MSVASQNQLMIRKLLLIVLLMGGFAYAMVPMYRKICEVVGISDSRDINYAISNTQVDTTRNITVEMLAAVNQNAPLVFEPVDHKVTLNPGAITTIHYKVVNTTNRTLVGQAVPSYAPVDAGNYISKIQCFCFNNQTFKPHEVREMPVVFTVKKEIPKDMSHITLAYTFFDITAEKLK